VGGFKSETAFCIAGWFWMCGVLALALALVRCTVHGLPGTAARAVTIMVAAIFWALVPSWALAQATAPGETASAAASAAAGAPPSAASTPGAAAAAAPAASAAPKSPVMRAPAWVAVPRDTGRLRAADIGVVINTADPVSVKVGRYYIKARRLNPNQVLRIALPTKPVLTPEEFERLNGAIKVRFGPAVQALALAWTTPYSVACNSITGALALGFDAELCKNGCAVSRASPYFNSASARPLQDHGFRPAMLLAGDSFEEVKALINRGVAADGWMAKTGRPKVNVLLLTTDDVARRVRTVLYPPPTFARALNVDVKVQPEADLLTTPKVLLAITGSVKPTLSPAPDWVPGGLGDHLTSYGGDLQGGTGQGTALAWLASGATASHGAVTEPCNHLQKFPHPQVLLLHYLQGATAIEAYWKSVLWPQQSLFVGEPLAAPFAGAAVAAPARFEAPRLQLIDEPKPAASSAPR
jgi:uncharacterized protein (TIGR03790 family)